MTFDKSNLRSSLEIVVSVDVNENITVWATDLFTQKQYNGIIFAPQIKIELVQKNLWESEINKESDDLLRQKHKSFCSLK